VSKQGFKELLVWQRSKNLAVSIYKLTNQGSIRTEFGLVDQMRRSAVSVPSNIAEGDERSTDRDSVRFFYISKGSLAELITQLEIAKEVGIVAGAEVDGIEKESIEIGKMLGALIKARSRTFRPALILVSVACLAGYFLSKFV
jgi:four helix bundle protein